MSFRFCWTWIEKHGSKIALPAAVGQLNRRQKPGVEWSLAADCDGMKADHGIFVPSGRSARPIGGAPLSGARQCPPGTIWQAGACRSGPKPFGIPPTKQTR